MGTSFEGRTPANIWGDMLQISNGNSGADTTLRNVSDGQGNDTPLQLSTLITRVKANTNGQVFDVCNVAGSVLFSVNTSTNKITAGSGVSFAGDGSDLTGVTPSGVGGASATGNLELQADSDSSGSGDIILKIGTKVVARIPYSYLAKLAVGVEEDYFHSPNVGNYDEITTLSEDDYFLAANGGKTVKISGTNLLGTVNISARENEIQPAGAAGAGLGYSLDHPSYMVGMDGFMNPYSPNFGSYYDIASGSIMAYVPKHYVKITTDNIYTYKSVYDYANETLAAADGYFLPRCFIDGGVIIRGYFRDKYPHNSIENNVAVSKKNRIPITSSGAVVGYGFADCTANGQTPTNTFGGALAVAKSRGNDFYNPLIFHDMDSLFLAIAHSQACVGTTYCAYKDVLPYFPKGNNNNALADADDPTVVYTTASNADYTQRSLTGSGVPFAKTTSNGQECGIADLNGCMSRVAIGLTSDGTNLYVLKESIAFKDLIDSTTGATGAFNIANFDSIGANPSAFTQIEGTAGWSLLGNGTNQVFSGETDRTQINYKMANVGLPLSLGYDTTGTDDFGKDGIYVPTAFPNYMCVISGLSWSYFFIAGMISRYLDVEHNANSASVGAGACLSNV
jgi:hypothetical protein